MTETRIKEYHFPDGSVNYVAEYKKLWWWVPINCKIRQGVYNPKRIPRGVMSLRSAQIDIKMWEDRDQKPCKVEVREEDV